MKEKKKPSHVNLMDGGVNELNKLLLTERIRIKKKSRPCPGKPNRLVRGCSSPVSYPSDHVRPFLATLYHLTIF